MKKITTKEDREIEIVVMNRNYNEKISWKRKLDKLNGFIEALKPIEDKISEILINEKQPILDNISEVRGIMVRECVHPRNFLSHDGNTITCKFCNKRLKVVGHE